jgi:hypothetical protein
MSSVVETSVVLAPHLSRAFRLSADPSTSLRSARDDGAFWTRGGLGGGFAAQPGCPPLLPRHSDRSEPLDYARGRLRERSGGTGAKRSSAKPIC